MKLGDIRKLLNTEKEFGSRFPVRVIFIERLSQYRDLVTTLGQECDVVLQLSDYCTSDDVYPNLKKLQECIEKEYTDQQILVPSMSEYLRLGIKRELDSRRTQFKPFWHQLQDVNSKTRIILPLYSCKELFERIIPTVDERQEKFLWHLDAESENDTISLSVYSPQFYSALDCVNPTKGLKKWFKEWDKCLSNPGCSLVTSLTANIENVSGSYSIQVTNEGFDYVAKHLSDGERLNKELGTDTQWTSLIPYMVENQPFSRTVEKALNLQSFSAIDALSKWSNLTSEQKWMVWLWCQNSCTNDYFSFAIKNAQNYECIEDEIINSILNVPSPTNDWIQQRQMAINALKIEITKNDFFIRMDQIRGSETKLKLLTYNSHEERVYAIRTISGELRKGASIRGILDWVKDRYQFLYEYFLDTDSKVQSNINDYFNWYKEHKLKNQFAESTNNDIYKVELEKFDSRYSKIRQFINKDAFVLWVDGMGVEWLPLLKARLSAMPLSADIKSYITHAIAPTETEFNEQWKSGELEYEKVNKLDILAHKGMPDDNNYFSCIDYQFSIINEVAEKAVGEIKNHEFVIITGDHGSSRLAALSFHQNAAINPPPNSTVRNHGRYCELNGNPTENDMYLCVKPVGINDKKYLVMTTHDHYKQSGNAAGIYDVENPVSGELHGGMTPEEYLVPVVVIKRSTHVIPLDYYIESEKGIRIGNNVTVKTVFTRGITNLTAKTASYDGISEPLNDEGTIWNVRFPNLPIGIYTIEVTVDNRMLEHQAKFTVESQGIRHNEDFLGDF